MNREEIPQYLGIFIHLYRYINDSLIYHSKSFNYRTYQM